MVTTTTTPATTNAPAKDDKLTAEERKALKRCETAIEKGQKVFLATAPAVLEIAEKRLWRTYKIDGKLCPSMTKYAEHRWDMPGCEVTRMKAAAKLLANLQAAGIETLPKNLAQCNEFSSLSDKDQVEVWVKVLESEKKPSASLIKGIVEEMFPVEETAADGEEAKPTLEEKRLSFENAICNLMEIESAIPEDLALMPEAEQDEMKRHLRIQVERVEELLNKIRACLN